MQVVVKILGALEPKGAQAGSDAQGKKGGTGSAKDEGQARVAQEVELQVAVVSVNMGSGRGGGGGGGGGFGGGRAREWYNQKVRQLLFNLR